MHNAKFYYLLSMSVKKTQKILININRATHERRLKQMRPKIDKSQPRTYNTKALPTNIIPYHQRYRIETDNKQLVRNILRIAQSPALQMSNTPSRPRRRSGMKEWQRKQDNLSMCNRIMHVKPAIGSVEMWKKDYSQSIVRAKRFDKLPSLRYDTEFRQMGQDHIICERKSRMYSSTQESCKKLQGLSSDSIIFS